MKKRNNINKKGQVNMLETIGVIFIFFVLVLFALIFYFKFQEVSFEQDQLELAGLRAIDTTLVTLFLPELQCTRGRAETIDNCVDLTKIDSVIETINNYKNDYYFHMFSFSKITVHEVYPSIEDESRSWVIYDHEKTRTEENDEGEEIFVPDWSIKEPTYFVVTLSDDLSGYSHGIEKGKMSVGYISVEVYS
jgi:hypothetical protein